MTNLSQVVKFSIKAFAVLMFIMLIPTGLYAIKSDTILIKRNIIGTNFLGPLSVYFEHSIHKKYSLVFCSQFYYNKSIVLGGKDGNYYTSQNSNQNDWQYFFRSGVDLRRYFFQKKYEYDWVGEKYPYEHIMFTAFYVRFKTNASGNERIYNNTKFVNQYSFHKISIGVLLGGEKNKIGRKYVSGSFLGIGYNIFIQEQFPDSYDNIIWDLRCGFYIGRQLK